MPGKRPRRTAEEARREILDAAERRLSEAGPDGIRLQQIAADVGVSHPAVLHHFGSREGLIRAVVQRAIESLEADVIEALSTVPEGGGATVLDLIEQAHHVLVEKGHARVVAWLLLSGHAPDARAARIRTIAEVAHQRRRASGSLPDYEDTVFRILLVGLVLFGESVAGPSMRESAGLGADPQAARKFRQWLARLVSAPVTSERDTR